MAYHTGRLIDHVHLRTRHFALSRHFYGQVLAVLGVPMSASGERWFQADELFVEAAGARIAASHIHLAFQAPDRETVDRFYEVALASGGTSNGAPGLRDYHPGYYACFVLDPDDNNIEAVFHGEARRSAPSVIITPAG
jgi:catechol 2,3-dioxygenase-like lactoylglutathione lyase family enzyme